MSAEAKDLIRKLLVTDPAKRLTCEQVGWGAHGCANAWGRGSAGGGRAPSAAAPHTLLARRQPPVPVGALSSCSMLGWRGCWGIPG